MMITTTPESNSQMTDQALDIIAFFYREQPELHRLLLKHVFQVRAKAFQILNAAGLELDSEILSAGALLHDIGIITCHAPGILCNGEAPYLTHGLAGAQMLREYGAANGLDLEPYARISERHTGSGLTAAEIIQNDLPLPPEDFLPETMEEILICLADKFFSKSGDMEEKPFPAVRRSMAKFGPDPLERFDSMCRLFQVDDSLPFIPEKNFDRF